MSGSHTPLPSWIPRLRSKDNEWILVGSHTEEQLDAAKLVGYHNYFMVGLYDAIDIIQSRCPPGWRGTELQSITCDPITSAYKSCVCVGQVRVHSGDPDFPLIIYKVEGASNV